MNVLFFAFVLIAFVTAGLAQFTWVDTTGNASSPMEILTSGLIEAASGSVELAIGLVGVMSLFLGLMKVAEAGGMLTIIARLIRPLMVRLFPDVPPNHPAMGAMILNMSANALGLGNAATPFGIRAMQELDKLNPQKGVASNSMALFLAINTSSVTLLPTGVIALRASAGSLDPAGILPTTLFATICSTAAAIIAAKTFSKFFQTSSKNELLSIVKEESNLTQADDLDQGAYAGWVSGLALFVLVSLIPITVIWGKAIAPWIIPSLMLAFLSFGVFRKVNIYDVFVEGAKEGFDVAIRIIPYLVAILTAVGMLRSSGALEVLVNAINFVTGPLGMPPEALPMALLRPLSGSGAYGVMASIIADPAIGPDSYVGYLVTTLQGSTETTFYVLAVYFGAVQVRRVRHALAAAITADLIGVIAAVSICAWMYG